MALLDYAAKVFGTIIPDTNADPSHQFRWRLSVALLLIGSVVLQGIHILIACGWLASFGLSGFAYANDLNAVYAVQARIEQRQMDKQLMDLEASLCRATAAGKPTRFIVEQLRAAMYDYKIISGQPWIRPTCAELGE